MKLGFAAIASLVLAGVCAAQVTQRVSIRTGGLQGNHDSFRAAISADCRYVAFESYASNLVPGDTNGVLDVFVRDRDTGITERVSVDSNGMEGNDESYDPAISADGRFIVFKSRASNLIDGFPGDTNGFDDVFLHDRQTHRTQLVSVNSLGRQGNGDSSDIDPMYGEDYYYSRPSMSADGRFVAFVSHATNLVPGDTNGALDVFVRDRQLGTTERVSISTGGTEGNGTSGRFGLSISGDGRYVTFESDATNLVLGDTNGRWDVFVRDRWNRTTERVSLATSGVQGSGDSFSPVISDDGRYVMFTSYAHNLVSQHTYPWACIYVRDCFAGTTALVSEPYDDAYSPSISTDGRFVAFETMGWGWYEVFLRDRQTWGIEWISTNYLSDMFLNDSDSDFAAVSADGRYVAFESGSRLLVPGDTNWSFDIFVRDRSGGTNFVSLCDPGVGGVLACPCSNPPNGGGRGCDNSSGAGGASLSASGGAFLSSDSLVFTVGGETPTALSVVFQGSTLLASGAIYGQGVRCAAGNLVRLFTRNAVGGSLHVPRFRAGDPTISARSASLGDVIQPGQSRWYLVYYRDPVVLGGCPASATFNATQTGRVDWTP